MYFGLRRSIDTGGYHPVMGTFHTQFSTRHDCSYNNRLPFLFRDYNTKINVRIGFSDLHKLLNTCLKINSLQCSGTKSRYSFVDAIHSPFHIKNTHLLILIRQLACVPEAVLRRMQHAALFALCMKQLHQLIASAADHFIASAILFPVFCR